MIRCKFVKEDGQSCKRKSADKYCFQHLSDFDMNCSPSSDIELKRNADISYLYHLIKRECIPARVFERNLIIKRVKGSMIIPSDLIQLIRKSKHIVLVPVAIIIARNLKHANILIINKRRKEYERFEPHGRELSDIDKIVKKQFCKLLPGYRYISPSSYCVIGPQMKDKIQHKGISDPNHGFCELWVLLYTQMRLMNIHLSRRLIVSKILEYAEVPNFMRSYITYINEYLS